jgi:CheY-like chemotaxis protein
MKPEPRILVVDDDPDFLEFVKTALESHRYRITVALDEEEALAKMEENKPDLLILDVMMSRADSGFQFMWQVRASKNYRTVPILMTTAVDKELHIDFARHANTPLTAQDSEYLPVEGYLVKPIKVEKLVSTVGWILERART